MKIFFTFCLSKISYFLFYLSSETTGIMSRHFPTKVRRCGSPRGFNVTTRSQDLPQVLRLELNQLEPSVICSPSHGRPNR